MAQKTGKRRGKSKKTKRRQRAVPRPRSSPRSVHLSATTRSLIKWFDDPWSAPTPVPPAKTLISLASYTGKFSFVIPSAAGVPGVATFNPLYPFNDYTQGTTLPTSYAFAYHSASTFAGSSMTANGGTTGIAGLACVSDFASTTINTLTKTWTPIGMVMRMRAVTTRDEAGGTLGAYTIAAPALNNGTLLSLEGASATGARSYRTWSEWPSDNKWRTAYWFNLALDDAQTVRVDEKKSSNNGIPFGLYCTSPSTSDTSVEVEYRLIGYLTGQDVRASSQSYPEDYPGYHAICNAYLSNWLGNGSGKVSEKDVVEHFLKQHSCLL